METLVFPDPVLAATSFLRAALVDATAPAAVGSKVPDARGRYVTIRLAGTETVSQFVERSVLHVNCSDTTAGVDSAQAAADLARLSRALLHRMVGTVQGSLVLTVTDVDSADVPDAISGDPRESFAIQISMRSTAL